MLADKPEDSMRRNLGPKAIRTGADEEVQHSSPRPLPSISRHRSVLHPRPGAASPRNMIVLLYVGDIMPDGSAKGRACVGFPGRNSRPQRKSGLQAFVRMPARSRPAENGCRS